MEKIEQTRHLILECKGILESNCPETLKEEVMKQWSLLKIRVDMLAVLDLPDKRPEWKELQKIMKGV